MPKFTFALSTNLDQPGIEGISFYLLKCIDPKPIGMITPNNENFRITSIKFQNKLITIRTNETSKCLEQDQNAKTNTFPTYQH